MVKMSQSGGIESPREVSSNSDDDVLFEYAPPVGLQRRLGLVRPGRFNIQRRAVWVVLIGWVPLLLLAIAQSLWQHADVVTPVLKEIGVHTRYLIAAPLLVLAEASCGRQLNVIIRNFYDIVSDADRGRLDAAISSTLNLLQSKLAEFLVIVLSYLVVAAAIHSHPADRVPPWATAGGITPIYSPAGWWHMLISLPLLLALLFGWIWRLVLWTRLLWRIARLDLQLSASHPDQCAGLGFLGQSVRAFAMLAFALAAIVAGRSAAVVMSGGNLPTPQLYFNVGLMLGIAALFIAPLLVFTPMLMQGWRRAIYQYGGLAEDVGQVFERKWLTGRRNDDAVLEEPDFSATADLYQVVSNAYAIRFVPLTLRDLAILVIAMLLPFLPVVVLVVPADVIWGEVRDLLL